LPFPGSGKLKLTAAASDQPLFLQLEGNKTLCPPRDDRAICSDSHAPYSALAGWMETPAAAQFVLAAAPVARVNVSGIGNARRAR